MRCGLKCWPLVLSSQAIKPALQTLLGGALVATFALLQGKELEHRRAKATAGLVTACGLANAAPTLDELADAAEPDDAEQLLTLKTAFAAVLKELTRLNAVNAKLTEQALAFVNYNLNLLTRRQAEPTYAPVGAAFKESALSALLDRKV